MNRILSKSISLVPQERIESKILLIRGKKVMIDRNLAELYGVETKHLIRQVRRNLDRFPSDFLLTITQQEVANLRYHFGTSSWGGRRYQVLAFTEHGILMLSSILNSPRAIQVNIQIMRTFTKLRELMISHKELAVKIEDLEKKFKEHDQNFVVVFQAIKELLQAPKEPVRKKLPIGFHVK